MKNTLFALFAFSLIASASAHQGMPHDHSTQTPAVAQNTPSAEQMALQARNLGLPEGTIQISGCVPGMGEHWANPRDLPFGPIYGVHNNKVVFVEVMIDQKSFLEGKSWVDILKPLPGHPINHVDIEFQPQGHEGFEVPHYDIHAYFVPHGEHLNFCLPAAQ